MKFISRILSLAVWRGRQRGGAPYLLAAALICAASTTMAAEEPKAATAAPAEAVIPVDAVVPQAKVTLEARRLPLSQVLAEVKKQAGANLTMGEGTFAREPKLTLSVTEMPLREWMESLGALYDVVWQEAGPNTFALHPSEHSEKEKVLRHIGTSYNFWNWPAFDGHRPEYLPGRGPDWKALVDHNLDLKAITTTGVPLADAPAELQQAVHAVIEQDVAKDLLSDTVLLNAANGPLRITVARPPGSGGYTIHAGQRNAKRVSVPLPLAVNILDPYGQTVGRFYSLPSSRGSELLNERELFPPTNPAAPPAAVGQQAEQQGGR